MKVTRAIREFIEQQVEIKAKEALEPLEKKRAEAIKNASADIEKLEKDMNAMFQEVLDAYNIKRDLNVRCPNITYYLPEVEECNEERNKIYDKRRSLVVEIIAEMELGGTKAELMEKINSIKF